MQSDKRTLQSIAERIWNDAAAERFHGSDPYDGLNSRLLAPVLGTSRSLRLLTIQAVKRSPLNLRRLLLVPKGLNPKALALFMTGIGEYPAFGKLAEEQAWIEDALLGLASLPDGRPAFASRVYRHGLAAGLAAGDIEMPRVLGWGYDFPWQGREFLQPPFSPTVVATSFVVDGLAASRSRCYQPVVEAAARFVSESLHRHQGDGGICFSYSPRDRTRIYNASLFAAKILARAAEGNTQYSEEWRSAAKQATDYVVSRQREDGAWLYGDGDHWNWVDNFHTGFVLETLDALARLLNEDRWNEPLSRGLSYYKRRLFEQDGTARYSDTNLYPLDPHAFAQGAVTFLKLQHRSSEGVEFARDILLRCISQLWDEKRGGFHFQKRRWYTVRTVHMRWSQAWMFRALCAFLAKTDNGH